jgi:lipopolysaccharide export system permease protein
MRISDRYIGKQVLVSTLYAVLVLGMILGLGNLFRQIKPLLVDQKAPLELVLRFVLSVLPLSLIYIIPWGFLSAVLLVFGRLSLHQEITAFRVAGVSLLRLAAPVFVIGIALSGLSLWLNVNVVPGSRADAQRLIYEQAVRDPASLLKPGVVQGDFKGDGVDIQKMLIEGRKGDWLEGFHFFIMPIDAQTNAAGTYVHAARAALKVDREKSQLRLKLEDAYFETRDEQGKVDMAFAERAEPLVIDLKNPKTRKVRMNAMSNEQIRDEIAHNTELRPERKVLMQTELSSRYSFSLACFSFAFIAVPLALQARRRDNSHGLLLSLLIGTGYFLMVMLADQFKNNLGATIMLWAPNVACILAGWLLFRKARYS